MTGMLAPDGRCKTLDASGNGYVRAETCVAIVLEKVASCGSAAALMKGSAVNQVLHSAHFQHPVECKVPPTGSVSWCSFQALAPFAARH